jgi:hypothetical protein
MLAKIDNSADGGLSSGADHHEIESLIFRHCESHPALQNSELRSIGSDHSDISIFQHTSINFGARFWAWRSSKACYVFSPLFLSYN